MMKRFFIIIFVIGIIFPGGFVAHAAVHQVVFVTSAQTIERNNASQPLSLQMQDETEKKTKAGETIDLVLSSTSKTGEFSSKSSVWKKIHTLVIQSRFANRTFYYKDSMPGTYTITSQMKGRVSGETWTATQGIVIRSSISTSTQLSSFSLAPLSTVSSSTVITKESFFSKLWHFVKRLFF